MDDLVLPSTAESVQRGRHHAQECYARVGTSDDIRAVVALVASELLTNAIRYGGGNNLCIAVFPVSEVPDREQSRRIRIEVSDGSITYPVIRCAGDDDDHGRGMTIVKALCNTWGVEVAVGGKTVWAEISI